MLIDMCVADTGIRSNIATLRLFVQNIPFLVIVLHSLDSLRFEWNVYSIQLKKGIIASLSSNEKTIMRPCPM